MPPTRIIHFSDAHLNIPKPGWRPADYLSKRLTGWLNWTVTSRGQRFADAPRRIRAIGDLIRQQKPDGVVFSGDASAIGFGTEAAAVAEALGQLEMPRLAVPGNHDYYTPTGVRDQGLERAFASWQMGERLDSNTYPFATRIGPLWLIGVNSCQPNSLVWDAHGRVDQAQLRRLDQLLTNLPAGPRVLVTHYPYCQRDGGPDNYWHGLRNRDELCGLVVRHRVLAWLCGHIHRSFVLEPTDERPFWMCCAGSATQDGCASIYEFTYDDQITYRQMKWTDGGYEMSPPTT
jgi:3',5'-cyclic AMP phosphodiesterase CpdA